MQLQNSFVVPADIETAWNTLLDVEKVAPCMPGATLTSVDGDDVTGNVKVKLGPVSMVYGGKATFLSKDADSHTAVIEGAGKETRGTGTAKALVTTTMVSEAPDRTRVNVTTELTITGKAAQFGRGVMQEVAGRLIDQFSANLAAAMTAPAESEPVIAAAATNGESAVPADVPADGPAGAPADIPAGAPAAASAGPKVFNPPTRSASHDSIDLLGTAGAPMLKMIAPVAGGVLLLLVVLWLIRRKK